MTRPEPGALPDAPGSYQFVDAEGRVVYVGKAKSLRQRVQSYFQDPAGLAERTRQMLDAADHVEWIVVEREAEALVLEHNLIKRFSPRFNVLLKDDKSYPWLALTVSQEWPRPSIFRGKRRPGVRYFGPYPNVGAVRSTLDQLVKAFPLRTCSDAKFRTHERLGRPCLLFHIDRCSGPCINAVPREEYDGYVEGFAAFLTGDTAGVARRLEAEMRKAADDRDYERASLLRDKLSDLRDADAARQMELDRPEDLDALSWAGDELELAVQVFHVRHGKVVGRTAKFLERVEDLSIGDLVGRMLVDLYSEDLEVPRRILLPEPPSDPDPVLAVLTARRSGTVAVDVPKRGPKRELVETVERNARDAFQRHRLQRLGDHNSRARALESLQHELGLPAAPLRIECYDMSHLQGTDYVGSMVVFEDAQPKKSDYRHYRVTTTAGNDDYGAMEEVLTRRLGELTDGDGDEPGGDGAAPARRHRRAYPPQLLLVDGGRGQLNVAVRVLERLGLADQVPVASLAKAFEEVYLPGRAEPLRLSRRSEALYLLQRLRDEAHRFAVSYHRTLRGKRMLESALEGVPGLGAKRRDRLVAQFGGYGPLREATRAELLGVSWLPDAVGAAVYDRLHEPVSRPAGPVVSSDLARRAKVEA